MTQLPEVDNLLLELDAGWLTIWFNRPENRNALSQGLTDDLCSVLNTVRDDRSVRGLTLRGKGGFFCAGGDLKSFKSNFQGGAQGAEDIALARVLPSMTVVAPADYLQTQKAVAEAAQMKGPVYLRLTRNESPVFTTKKTPFEVGKAQVLKKGEDISIIACGPIVHDALLAARELELKFRIDAEVINCHTIKPLDEEVIVLSALKTKKVLTIEEHQVAGGLGGAIAELLSEKVPTSVYKMGLKDTFSESGSYKDLLNKYELSREHIVKKVKSLVLPTHGKK